MLNDSIYQQYLETENNRRLREAEAGTVKFFVGFHQFQGGGKVVAHQFVHPVHLLRMLPYAVEEVLQQIFQPEKFGRYHIGQRRRLKLAERYAGLCGRNLYGEIEHLARNTGRKARRVIKDLQKMMKLGMFPEGHLDEKKTCFMLNDSIYQQYLETENNRSGSCP